MKIGWRSDPIGVAPYQVTAVEVTDRRGELWLRWREHRRGGERNWRYRKLLQETTDARGVTRTQAVVLRAAGGRVLADRVRWAEEQAREQHLELVRASTGSVPPGSEEGAAARMLTIGETEALVCHPRTGLYPSDTRHRREVQRSLRFAGAVWGEGRAWSTIRRAQLRELGRQKLEVLQQRGLPGGRGAEVVVSRILTVAAWLRDEQLIPADAALAPRQWKEQLREESGRPDVRRARYTPEEYRALLAVAGEADPRLGLLTALGIEYRLGQVVRLRRSDLDLTPGVERVRVRGRGKKGGALIRLTPGQVASAHAALTTGYLRELEAAGGDYPLFPRGQLRDGRKGAGVADERHRDAGPTTKEAIAIWWGKAERLAGIEHLPGRGWYGARRVAVDLVKAAKVSREGLQAAGGWSDSTVPDQIYADQAMEYAQEEAMRARAGIRGEGEADPKAVTGRGTSE